MKSLTTSSGRASGECFSMAGGGGCSEGTGEVVELEGGPAIVLFILFKLVTVTSINYLLLCVSKNVLYECFSNPGL